MISSILAFSEVFDPSVTLVVVISISSEDELSFLLCSPENRARSIHCCSNYNKANIKSILVSRAVNTSKFVGYVGGGIKVRPRQVLEDNFEFIFMLFMPPVNVGKGSEKETGWDSDTVL